MRWTNCTEWYSPSETATQDAKLEGLESMHKFSEDPIDLKEMESRMERIREETAHCEARLLLLRRALTADKL